MKKLGMLIAGWLLATGLAFAQVNINTASQEELDGLKGIGPTKARAIVDYRKKNGPFKSVDDLEKVPGIGPATLQDLRGEVSVSAAARSSTAATAAGPAKMANEMAKPVTPGRPVEMSKPASPPLAKPAAPAMPGKKMSETAPVPGSAPLAEKPAAQPAPAAPARPAMPGKMAPEAKPAAPTLKPAAPAPAQPMAKPAAPAAPASKPAVPAKPALPARPAQPAAVN